MLGIMTPAAGDFPADCALIELHLSELGQIFNSLDPTPFRTRDLDPNAEDFIAGWAREIPGDKPLGLLIHVDSAIPASGEETVHHAVRDYFAQRAAVTRQRLRLLFRRGRISLIIGLVFLAAS